MQLNEITLKIKSSNPVDFKTKVKALEAIAMLDIQTMERLGELAKSSKAVAKLNSNWLFVKNLVL